VAVVVASNSSSSSSCRSSFCTHCVLALDIIDGQLNGVITSWTPTIQKLGLIRPGVFAPHIGYYLANWLSAHFVNTTFGFSIGRSTLWPQNAGATGAALASGSASGGCHCPAWLHLTWPPTVSWSPKKVVISCVLPTQGYESSDGPTAAMMTDALLLQVRGCGAVCQLIWDKLTLTLNSLTGC